MTGECFGLPSRCNLASIMVPRDVWTFDDADCDDGDDDLCWLGSDEIWPPRISQKNDNESKSCGIGRLGIDINDWRNVWERRWWLRLLVLLRQEGVNILVTPVEVAVAPAVGPCDSLDLLSLALVIVKIRMYSNGRDVHENLFDLVMVSLLVFWGSEGVKFDRMTRFIRIVSLVGLTHLRERFFDDTSHDGEICIL